MHEFWETMGYLANTIIFVITGVCISYNISRLDGMGWRDVGVTMGLYMGGICIRMSVFWCDPPPRSLHVPNTRICTRHTLA